MTSGRRTDLQSVLSSSGKTRTDCKSVLRVILPSLSRPDRFGLPPLSEAIMAARSFKQDLVGCFGQPVAENPTQVMIEAAFRHMGLDWRYLTLEVSPANLSDAVRGARAMGF